MASNFTTSHYLNSPINSHQVVLDGNGNLLYGLDAELELKVPKIQNSIF